MGGAIARALCKATTDIFLSDPSVHTPAFASELGCSYGDNLTAANSCDRLFLAVKPQIMASALAPAPQYEINTHILLKRILKIIMACLRSPNKLAVKPKTQLKT